MLVTPDLSIKIKRAAKTGKVIEKRLRTV